jgi:hypothetical protein
MCRPCAASPAWRPSRPTRRRAQRGRSAGAERSPGHRSHSAPWSARITAVPSTRRQLYSDVKFLDERLPPRFWEKCIPEPNSGCWLWIGATTDVGYGHLWWLDAGRLLYAHRVAYEALVGPLRLDHVDHLCRTPCCVNPAHLEDVTHRENLLRGDTFAAANVRKTMCPSGHPYNETNTRHERGHRKCRICDAARHREARRLARTAREQRS